MKKITFAFVAAMALAVVSVEPAYAQSGMQGSKPGMQGGKMGGQRRGAMMGLMRGMSQAEMQTARGMFQKMTPAERQMHMRWMQRHMGKCKMKGSMSKQAAMSHAMKGMSAADVKMHNALMARLTSAEKAVMMKMMMNACTSQGKPMKMRMGGKPMGGGAG